MLLPKWPDTMHSSYYERDMRCIPAHHQLALLVDFASSRGIDTHRLLRGTGLFYEDFLSGKDKPVSCEHYLLMLGNLNRLLTSGDTPFLAGERLLPGHCGAASQALLQAENLYQAFLLLMDCQVLLSPLLVPRFYKDKQIVGLYWQDVTGLGDLHDFVITMQITAVSAMCRWLSGQRLPWRYVLDHSPPQCLEQYQVHWSEDIVWNGQINGLFIASEWLEKPWPRAAHTAATLARRAANEQMANITCRYGWLAALYDYLLTKVEEPVSLEQAAQHFQMSPATFKRHLHKHGTHFQAQYDMVRKHTAMYLLHVCGEDNDSVARRLCFHDANNFRRSFKRWTGITPSGMRALFYP